MVDEILHRKLKIGQPKAHWKFQIGKRMSCSPSGTCCVTVKRQDYNLISKSCWIWIPYKMGVKTNQTSHLRGNRSGHHNTKLTRGSQEPVIAHLVFNLTSKVDRKWGCYTSFWKWDTQRSFQLKFLSKRFWCDFYHIIFLNGLNWLKTSHRKTQNIC